MQIDKTCKLYCSSKFQILEHPNNFTCMKKLLRTPISKADYRTREETTRNEYPF